MDTDHGRVFIRKIIEAKEPRYWLIAAILATFTSNALYDLLKMRFWEPGVRREVVWLLALAVVPGLILLSLLPKLTTFLHRRRSAPGIAISSREKIKRPRALIVFVSSPNPHLPKKAPQDSHQAVVQHFLNEKGNDDRTPISVYLVHSAESRQNAVDYANYFRAEPNSEIAPAWEGLEADFDNFESAYRVVIKAITRALDASRAEDILLDLTGGTKLATSGGLIAGIERGISLSYIVQSTKEIKVLDIDWLMQNPPRFLPGRNDTNA